MKQVVLYGYPVAHSVSPAMHNAAFRALGLTEWTYRALAVPPDQLGAALAEFRREGYAGANVTVPHKEHVMEYVDELTARAREIGAVNTLVVRGGRVVGDNTDGAGFLRALTEGGGEPRGRRAVVLGAGGAARAVCLALAGAGAAALTLLNRTPGRAARLAEDLRALYPSLPVRVNFEPDLAVADLVVNATSVGLSSDATPLPPGASLARDAWVMDLVYHPAETHFLRQARAAGARPLGGLEMLVYQGALAFELWTGLTPPVEVMRLAAQQALDAAQKER